MHNSQIRTVSGDGRLSPKSPTSPQQTIEVTNAELLTHALSKLGLKLLTDPFEIKRPGTYPPAKLG